MPKDLKTETEILGEEPSNIEFVWENTRWTPRTRDVIRLPTIDTSQKSKRKVSIELGGIAINLSLNLETYVRVRSNARR